MLAVNRWPQASKKDLNRSYRAGKHLGTILLSFPQECPQINKDKLNEK